MAGKTSAENGKKGGRPKGKKNAATLKKEAVLAEYRQKIMRSADVLYRAQMTRATGMTFLYKIEKYYEGSGKSRVLKTKKPALVENQNEIEEYLQGLIEDADIDDPKATYYFITTTPPDNKAIDSMIDRALGKPANVMVTEDEDGKTQPITGIIIQQPNEPKPRNTTK